MSSPDDPDYMITPAISSSDELMDAVLAGRPTAGHEPGVDELTSLVRVAQGPIAPEELSGRAAAVAALTTGVTSDVVPIRGRRRVPNRMVAAKAAVAVAVLCTTGVAAAATGVIDLDASRSDRVITTSSPSDSTATKKGLSSTTTGHGAATSTTSIVPTTSTTPGSPAPSLGAVGPSAIGPARDGLCNAFGAREELPGKSVAARNLFAAAAAAGQTVTQFCAEAPPATTTTAAPSSKGAGQDHTKPPTNGANGQGGSSVGGVPNANANPTAGGSSNANPASNAGGSSANHTTGEP